MITLINMLVARLNSPLSQLKTRCRVDRSLDHPKIRSRSEILPIHVIISRYGDMTALQIRRLAEETCVW